MSETPMLVFLAFIDLAKTAAWPVAVLLVAHLFRADIRSLLPRVEEVGPGGVKLGKAAAQQAAQTKIATEAPSDPSSVQLKELPGLSRTVAIAQLEQQIHTQLNAIPSEQQIDRLVRLLAEERIISEFERIYRFIYGSQIRGLRKLNATISITVADAREQFEKTVRSVLPDFYGTDDAFDIWLGFLINTGLVTQAENKLELSPLGRDFLQFLTARRLSDEKPY